LSNVLRCSSRGYDHEMAKRKLTVGGVDVTSRAFRVSQALASTRLEGKVTPRSWKKVLDRYVAGEIGDEELVAIATADYPPTSGEA
jgi:hypothetical protein